MKEINHKIEQAAASVYVPISTQHYERNGYDAWAEYSHLELSRGPNLWWYAKRFEEHLYWTWRKNLIGHE